MSAPAPPLGMIDFWRASPADALPDGYKEWSHFSILAHDFDLIINLSFSGALPASSSCSATQRIGGTATSPTFR
jgi:hypothetical protein